MKKEYENNTINSILTSIADRFPNKVILKQRNTSTKQIEEYKTSQIIENVEKLIEWLLKNNINNKHIAIISENSYIWILCSLAIVCSGNVAVFMDPNVEVEEIVSLLKFNDCEYLLFSKIYEQKAEKIKSILDIVTYKMEGLLALADKCDSKCKLENIDIKSNDPAFIVFTSGTTGEKRGVLLSHQNASYEAMFIGKATSGKGCLTQILPLYHIYSFITVLADMYFGGTIFINQSPRFIKNDIIESDASIVCAVPVLLPVLYDIFSKMDTNKKRKISCGGAAGSKIWYERFKDINIDIYNGYGLTEACGCIGTNSEQYELEDDCVEVLDGQDICIDNPDENGVGEILVKGPNIMIGYYKMPEATNEAITNGYLRTGDLGILKDKKILKIVGRKKNIIVLSNGENISPEQIENKIMSINGVKECIAFEKNGELCVLIYADKQNENYINNKTKEIKHSFSRNMFTFKTTFTNEPLEKNATGKIIRGGNNYER